MGSPFHLWFLVHGHYQPVIFGSQRGNEQRPSRGSCTTPLPPRPMGTPIGKCHQGGVTAVTFLTELGGGEHALASRNCQVSLCCPDKLHVFLQRPRPIRGWLPEQLVGAHFISPTPFPTFPFNTYLPPQLFLRITIIKHSWGNQELCHGT